MTVPSAKLKKPVAHTSHAWKSSRLQAAVDKFWSVLAISVSVASVLASDESQRGLATPISAAGASEGCIVMKPSASASFEIVHSGDDTVTSLCVAVGTERAVGLRSSIDSSLIERRAL